VTVYTTCGDNTNSYKCTTSRRGRTCSIDLLVTIRLRLQRTFRQFGCLLIDVDVIAVAMNLVHIRSFFALSRRLPVNTSGDRSLSVGQKYLAVAVGYGLATQTFDASFRFRFRHVYESRCRPFLLRQFIILLLCIGGTSSPLTTPLRCVM